MDLYVIQCEMIKVNSLNNKLGKLKEFMTAEEYKRRYDVLGSAVIDIHIQFMLRSKFSYGYSMFYGHRGEEFLFDMSFYNRMSTDKIKKTHTYGYQIYLKLYEMIIKQVKRDETIKKILI